jgi:DHA1 family tetracycline resistance protein-like MFS transporter
MVLRTYPLVAGLAVSFIFIGLAQRGMEGVWVLYTAHRFGWDEGTNGLSLALVGFMAILVQGGLVRPFVGRFGERRSILFGLVVATFAFLGYGLATEGWMMFAVIVVGALGGVSGPAIQGLIAGTVEPQDQGKIQGAITSLMSLTSIFAPLTFAAGLFSYFTSPAAPFDLPGAPFLVGSALWATSFFVLLRLFRRFPAQ